MPPPRDAGTTDAGTDASANEDAGQDAASDASSCPSTVPQNPPGALCGTAPCTGTEVCCLDASGANGTCVATANLCGTIKWGCNASADCSGGSCCGRLSAKTPAACFAFENGSNLGASACESEPCENLGRRRLCKTSTECTEPGKPVCKPAHVYLGTSTTPITVGICSAQ